ncbi:MAG TPA: endolytic transglycosylase MltG [Bacteroidota bacterium]|nr:endolytic transglycosylase MltG [Bacteroidota bacterium]
MNAKNLLPKSNSRSVKLLQTSAVVVVLLVLASLYFLLWESNSFDPSPKIVTVSRGESFSQAVDAFSASGLLNHPTLFKISGKVFGYAGKIKIGKYSFTSGMSNREILYAISTGTSTANPSVTIYEGLRGTQIARILRKEVGIDSAKLAQELSDTSLIQLKNHGASSLEGFLLPDTYEFYWQVDEKEIIRDMLGEFRKFFADSLQERARKMRMTIGQVLTMASIVEGETVLDRERPIIAGLYYNRLRRGMKLEADPTIQYLIPDGPRRLLYNDLKIASPYNTYQNYGLPPGPINNPGRKSILAALYPAQHNYLYFVADGLGGHRFARTFDEHLKNVRAYRRAHAAALPK